MAASDHPLIRTIRLENLLSYGGEREPFELGKLNVLIGTNASGKSNLIEALALLAEAPRDLLRPIREGGGVEEWLWKGGRRLPGAQVALTLTYPRINVPLHYRLAFTAKASRFELVDETLSTERPFPGYEKPYLYYAYQKGKPVLNVVSPLPTNGGNVDDGDGGLGMGAKERGRGDRNLEREDVLPNQSILSQRRDADLYPELTWVGMRLGELRFFREWNLGRLAAARLPQKVDLPEDFLLEDTSNLGLVLNNLLSDPAVKRELLAHLRSLYEEVEDIATKLQGGTVQIYFHEKGLAGGPIPATRLSDGSLRFLCLLTLLCHPDPPPVICIEEPEVGLHPDAITTVAELLIDASERTQLIVTTHSDVLVSALSEVPESVIVTERDEHGTQLRRLDREALAEWLDKYRLGELWQMGELGGVRW